MEKECKICNTNKSVDIVCKLDETNIDRFKSFSLIKYNSYLDQFLKNSFEISISHCRNCNFFWYTNMPTNKELTEMYANSNSINPKLITRESEKKVNRNKLLLKRILRTYFSITKSTDHQTSKIRLLDFGSGTGEFSRLALQNGLNVIAYDPSLNRNTLDENDKIKYYNDVNKLPLDYFDIIILNQVLEHVPQPIETLKLLNVIGKKNVLIYIAVPNLNNTLEGKNIWKEWPYNNKNIHTMAPFEHLNGFTPFALRKIINKTGFSVLPLKNKFYFSIRYALVDEAFNLLNLYGTTQALITKQK